MIREEEADVDEPVEMEGGELGRDADRLSRLLTCHGLRGTADDAVEAPAHVVIEQRQRRYGVAFVHRPQNIPYRAG